MAGQDSSSRSLSSATAKLDPTALAKLSETELRVVARAIEEERRLSELERCLDKSGKTPGPLYWLQYHTETFDEKWQEKSLSSPYRKFPDLPYLPWLFEHFISDRRLFVPKSREMMASWSVVGYAVWTCQFFPRQRVIVQSQKEDKVADLIKGVGNPGYARTLVERQPSWLREKYPLTKRMEDMPATMISWANGSTLQGVPKGACQQRVKRNPISSLKGNPALRASSAGRR
jgi:hypothetical protein